MDVLDLRRSRPRKPMSTQDKVIKAFRKYLSNVYIKFEIPRFRLVEKYKKNLYEALVYGTKDGENYYNIKYSIKQVKSPQGSEHRYDLHIFDEFGAPLAILFVYL